MIVYKVVEKRTRHCSNWALCKSYGVSNKKLKRWLNKHHPGFFPRYLKGTTVTAALGSVGILTFEEHTAARVFKSDYNSRFDANTIIIKVEGIGEPLYNIRIVPGCGETPKNIYLLTKRWAHAPSGTVAFPAVKVLE